MAGRGEKTFGSGFQLGGLQKIFGFGLPTSAEHAYSQQTRREDYDVDDIKLYWDAAGILAVETNYDRLDKILARGLDPIDVMLQLAAESNDVGMITELVAAGADLSTTDLQGRTPAQIATLPAAIKALTPADEMAAAHR